MTKEDTGDEAATTVVIKGADGKVHYIGSQVINDPDAAGATGSPQEEEDLGNEGQVEDDGEEFIATGELYRPQEG